MPIQIVSPTTGQTSGWGFEIIGSSDVVAPIGETVRWWFVLRFRAPLEGEIFVDSQAYDGPGPFTKHIGQPDPGLTKSIPIPDGTWVNGGEAELAVQLRTTQNEILTQTVVPVIHDTVTGMAHLLQKQTTTEGGFSEEDRVVLMQMRGGLLWDLIGELVPELLELAASHLPTSFQPITYSPLVCDETVLVRPTLPAFVRWVGIRWRLVQWPSGLGIVDGFPDHTYGNWGQISLTKLNTDGQAIVYESKYEERFEGEILWGTNEPYNVQVYVLPGVCVEFQALSGPPWSVAASGLPEITRISSSKPRSSSTG